MALDGPRAPDPDALAAGRRRGVFRVAGIDVRVRPSALVTFGLLGALVLNDIWGARGVPNHTAVLIALVAASSFLVSVLFHELGHAVVGRQLGLEVKEVTIFYLGGLTRLDREPERAEDELAIALAGPVTNLLAAGVLLVAAHAVGERTLPGVLLAFLGELNGVIGVFNLLPGHPLDGGAILRAALWATTNDRLRGARWTARAGQGLGYGLIAVGAVGAFRQSGTGQDVGYLWLVIIGLFVLTAARAGLVQADVRARLQGLRVADLATVSPWTADLGWTVARVVALVARTDAAGLVLDTGGRAVGMFGPGELAEIPSASWDHLTVGETMRELHGSVDHEAGLLEVLQRFEGASSSTAFAVLADGRPVGVLEARQILARLQAATP